MASPWRIILSAVLISFSVAFRLLRTTHIKPNGEHFRRRALSKATDTDAQQGVPFTLRNAGDVREHTSRVYNTHFHFDQKRKSLPSFLACIISLL
jgi:hypothetical protein